MKAAYQITFPQRTPGGYEGTHHFITIKDATAFWRRFESRTGIRLKYVPIRRERS